ncbi:SDR family NAD(P)-dependent oxidoreductase [Paenibacillus sp. KR2-11]|uniref:SDR family NAD(P)-dependent oxidoreductase n=1 Tax=Paenibacillus sp. KR2-11 TaxID=3385500 RepID=UPI0038FC0085
MYLITGTSRGLGEALALQLLGEGGAVVGLNRTANPGLREAADAAGSRYEETACDLAEPLAAAAAFEAFLNEAGWLREAEEITLINNAGVLEPMGPAGEADPAAQQAHLLVNLAAPLLLTSAFLRAAEGWPLTTRKQVVNISSGAGRKPYAGWSAYCSAKAGLDMMTRCIALEQGEGPGAVKIAAVAPGVVDTAMQEQIRAEDPRRFPEAGRFVGLKETGGLYTPEEAARRLAAWLKSGSMGQGDIVDIRHMPSP